MHFNLFYQNSYFLGKEKEEKGSGQTLLLIRLDLSINGSKLPSSFVELIEKNWKCIGWWWQFVRVGAGWREIYGKKKNSKKN